MGLERFGADLHGLKKSLLGPVGLLLFFVSSCFLLQVTHRVTCSTGIGALTALGGGEDVDKVALSGLNNGTVDRR